MALKYDASNAMVSEIAQMQTLFAKGSTRTGSGSGSWTSTSSSTVYNFSAGEQDLYTQLQTVLTPYMITAANFNAAAPTGEICWFASATPTTGYLRCNGAAISRSTYSALFTEIGTVYGVGDGTTTFNVPDVRGEFVRGWDDSRGVDTGRVFGSAQTDEFKVHGHRVWANNSLSSSVYGAIADSWFRGLGGPSGGSGAYATNDTYSNAIVESSGGAETRPRNIAFLACIRY